MTLPEINPILVQFGPVAIRWYALAYVAGIGLGWYYISRLIRKESLWAPKGPPVSDANLEDLLLWMALGIIVGGRIGYMLFYDFSNLFNPLWRIFLVNEGGMSFHGGFAGVVLAGVLYSRRHKINPYRLGDLLACAAPIGLFLGRVANFINGELWGRPTDVPWGVTFCNSFIEQQYGGICPAGELPRHPSQLYEAALEGLILFVVLFVLTHYFKKLQKPGFLMGVFVAGYGLSRIIVETVRTPDSQMPEWLQGDPLTMGMLLSVPMVLVGVFFMWAAQNNKTQDKDAVA